jgi:hypothetical protein
LCFDFEKGPIHPSPLGPSILTTRSAWALLEKLSTSESESEEYGLKEDSRTAEIDPLTRKF